MANRLSRRYFCCFSLVLLSSLFLPLSLPAAPPSAQKPIVRQAEVFLQLLDQQKPLKAWQLTTLYFKKKIPSQSWQQLYQAKRQRLGKPLARRFAGYRFHSTFEQAADGLYLRINYRTDFAARANVVERIEMYKDFDGRWRVIGYFLELD